MVVDESGLIQLANAQAEKLFGYTREELIGKPVEMLVPEELRARPEPTIVRAAGRHEFGHDGIPRRALTSLQDHISRHTQ